MPGDCYEGEDPSGALTRGQFVALLEDFARRNALPIEPDTAVSELGHENGAYRLTTSRGTVSARNVIVASGSLDCPVRPVWAAALPSVLRQIDASGYRSHSDLPDGVVLVVGSCQSGVRIAEELAEAGRTGRIPARGVLGSVHTISLQALSVQGIVLLGRLTGVEDGADDLEANVRFR
ncbi:FAD dependent oxidoreductase [Rhizobium grahamii CCGE 502]|uniref:FAD dependent oxidoreductase n=2 Tax=Rhizobium grahamii TaxID=1120045 RepID=S3HDQ2_9HYPH|nr:FAD dependent oxidoreductase [Rhizobium grahamii CCGE 502]